MKNIDYKDYCSHTEWQEGKKTKCHPEKYPKGRLNISVYFGGYSCIRFTIFVSPWKIPGVQGAQVAGRRMWTSWIWVSGLSKPWKQTTPTAGTCATLKVLVKRWALQAVAGASEKVAEILLLIGWNPKHHLAAIYLWRAKHTKKLDKVRISTGFVGFQLKKQH